MPETPAKQIRSLGPWNESKCNRLFSFHNIIYKIRLNITQVHSKDELKFKQTIPTAPIDQKPKPMKQEPDKINNPYLQRDIDKCIASILRNPGGIGNLHFIDSANSVFNIELRNWTPNPKFVREMRNGDETPKMYPVSFKVSGKTIYELFIGDKSESKKLDVTAEFKAEQNMDKIKLQSTNTIPLKRSISENESEVPLKKVKESIAENDMDINKSTENSNNDLKRPGEQTDMTSKKPKTYKNKEDEPSAKPGEDKSSLESDQEKSAKPSEDKPAEAPRRSCVIM